jgi:hypothetical protein
VHAILRDGYGELLRGAVEVAGRRKRMGRMTPDAFLEWWLLGSGVSAEIIEM